MTTTDPLDRDNDGRKGGSLPDPERKALIAALEARDIKFFKGAKTDKLRELLAATEDAAPDAPSDQQPQEPIMTDDAPAPAPPVHPDSPAARFAAIQDREARLVAEEKAQKATVEAAQTADGLVAVRILKVGDGKVAKGFAINGVEQYHARGEVVRFPADIAKVLEDRGLVESED